MEIPLPQFRLLFHLRSNHLLGNQACPLRRKTRRKISRNARYLSILKLTSCQNLVDWGWFTVGPCELVLRWRISYLGGLTFYGNFALVWTLALIFGQPSLKRQTCFTIGGTRLAMAWSRNVGWFDFVTWVCWSILLVDVDYKFKWLEVSRYGINVEKIWNFTYTFCSSVFPAMSILFGQS